MKRILAVSILALLGLSAGRPLRAGETVVYRCVDARGNVSLQDHACAARQTEQRRSIATPADPPLRAAASPPAARVAAEADDDASPPRNITVTVVNPQPLYECRREDGSVYESATGIPERRWVPLWVVERDPRRRTPAPSTVGTPRHRLPVVDGYVYGAGTWMQDACFQLPQSEVCTRRRGLLADLDHKRRLAFPSERVSLDLQHRGLREQLQRECDQR